MSTLQSSPTGRALTETEAEELKGLMEVGRGGRLTSAEARRSISATDAHGAAAAWLVKRIKETNGDERYVVGYVAHIGRFEDPFEGADQLYQLWRKERVAPMHEGDIVPSGGKGGGGPTITLRTARRLIQFVRDNFPLDVHSDFARGMTFECGCLVLERYLAKYKDLDGPISRRLAYEIQCFAGVAYVDRQPSPYLLAPESHQ